MFDEACALTRMTIFANIIIARKFFNIVIFLNVFERFERKLFSVENKLLAFTFYLSVEMEAFEIKQIT